MKHSSQSHWKESGCISRAALPLLLFRMLITVTLVYCTAAVVCTLVSTFSSKFFFAFYPKAMKVCSSFAVNHSCKKCRKTRHCGTWIGCPPDTFLIVWAEEHHLQPLVLCTSWASHTQMCVCAALEGQLCCYLFVEDKVMKVQGKAHISNGKVLRKMHDLGLLLELCGVIMHDPLSDGCGCKRTSTFSESPKKDESSWAQLIFSCSVLSI